MFTIDAHLDLSMNALEWNRDLRQPVSALRRREEGQTDKPDRAKGTVSLPALREGRIGLVVATQIGRFVAPDNPLPGWHSPAQAWAQTQGQLAWYKAMEDEGEMVMIRDKATLDAHVARWMAASAAPALDAGATAPALPIGYILSLEGADSIVTLDHLHRAYASGLRALGPAHYGPGRYANGTDATGRLNADGKALLREMAQLGLILDATHLCDDAFWDAMELYDGPIWASHNNCRALVDHNRQFSDDMIRVLIQKGAVIGGALDAWMMVPGWVRGRSNPKDMGCTLSTLVDHLDHICQVAGNARHIGLGTDLDGAFGKEQSPDDLETIADLSTIPALLSKRGYAGPDIENVMHGNWLRFLRNAWALLALLLVFCCARAQRGASVAQGYPPLRLKAERLFNMDAFDSSARLYDTIFATDRATMPGFACYDAARAWAKAGNKDKAFFYLHTAVRDGHWSLWEHTATSDDLALLHDDARWQPLLKEIKAIRPGAMDGRLVAGLDTILVDDQADRMRMQAILDKEWWKSPKALAMWPVIMHKDSVNLEKIKVILNTKGWLGPEVVGTEGATTIFLVIQHADSLTQVTYLPLLRAAVAKGAARPWGWSRWRIMHDGSG